MGQCAISNDNGEGEGPADGSERLGAYQPSFDDFFVLLLNIYRSNGSCSLPLELILSILRDFAAYFPVLRAENNKYLSCGDNGNVLYLRVPVPLATHVRISEVRVVVDGHDQGWSSYPEHHGTRVGSYTWYELVISRKDRRAANDVRTTVCRNLHASREYERQERTFTHPLDKAALPVDMDAELIQKDREERQFMETMSSEYQYCVQQQVEMELQLYVRSMYPGWVNHIRCGSLEVHFKIDDGIKRVVDEYMLQHPITEKHVRQSL